MNEKAQDCWDNWPSDAPLLDKVAYMNQWSRQEKIAIVAEWMRNMPKYASEAQQNEEAARGGEQQNSAEG